MYIVQFHRTSAKHTYLCLSGFPHSLTGETAIATDADTLQVGAGHIHLHITFVSIGVDVRIVVGEDSGGEEIALKSGAEIAEHRAVTLHINVVIALGVDDVNAPKIGDVGKRAGNLDMLPNNVLLCLRGSGIVAFIILLRCRLTTRNQQGNGSAGNVSEIFPVHIDKSISIRCKDTKFVINK